MSVSLASIVTRICARVGILDIDVTDLHDVYVEGYSISKIMSAANAIEPLRQVGFFDIVESGTTLKFVCRGKPAVRTLSVDDIGASDVVDEEDPKPAVTTRKVQDVDLPRQIRVHFRNPDRDYEDDEEISPPRITTDAVNDIDVEISVAITAEQAAQVAEVLWADPWAGRWQHSASVDISNLDLEAGDVINLPVDNRLERVRIVAIDDAAQGLIRKLEMVRDDDGSYVAEPIVDAPLRTLTFLTSISGTELVFMDLPALRTEDTDAGFYIAARSNDSGNRWRGASIYRSTDDGATFEEILQIATEATTGTLDGAVPSGTLPVGSPIVWDDANTITVTLASGTLESRTEAELEQNGANTAAIGVDGRWEIIQFANAVQVDTDTWQLSHLLRGRRGTEFVMGLSQTGDMFVLVSGSGIIRAPLQISEIGEQYIYKAVSIEQLYADGEDYSYAGSGRSLIPFASTNLTAVRQSNGDILLSWTGRDRLGQELTNYVDGESDPPTTYEIDVYNTGSPSSVVRTITTSSTSTTYTVAQQTTDWGSPTPTNITFAVYKKSVNVGRGIKAQLTTSIF